MMKALPAFFTLVAAKYTDMTYTMVSELPISIAAATEGRLSAPQVERSSVKDAVAAEPEMGLVTARGSISGGMPIAVQTGDTALTIRDGAPLALNIARATISAVIVGRSDRVVLSPAAEPLVNASKALFLRAIINPARRIMIGITRADAFDIVNSLTLFPFCR